jgi:hypothetical protein
MLTNSAGDQNKKNEMGEACCTNRGRRGAYWVLVERPEEKRPLGSGRLIWEDNIKMDLQEIGCVGMKWINVAQDMKKASACEFDNAVMSHRAP